MNKLADYKMQIANNLKHFRREKGLTQAEFIQQLNKKLGTSYTSNALSSWEAGKNSINVNLMPAFAEILGISLERLFGQDGPDLSPFAQLTEEEKRKVADYISYLLYCRSLH